MKFLRGVLSAEVYILVNGSFRRQSVLIAGEFLRGVPTADVYILVYGCFNWQSVLIAGDISQGCSYSRCVHFS